MKIRTMSVSGSFYPSAPSDVNAMIARFNEALESHPDVMDSFGSLRTHAVIVPHAGWIYSGFTANIAHRILSLNHPSTVVVIGPSHRIGFEGVSIADVDLYQTPLGELRVDTDLVKELRQRFDLPYFPEAHHEHSTEVQIPFLKHYLDDVKVVELVYAYADPSLISPIISYLLDQKGTSVVISTDLSHYYTLEQAKRLDAICLEAIRTENPDMLHQGCEACGAIGVEAMLDAARRKGIDAVLLDYRTSADASGESSRVVGYASALFKDK